MQGETFVFSVASVELIGSASNAADTDDTDIVSNRIATAVIIYFFKNSLSFIN